MRDPPLTRSHHSHLPGFNELTRLDGRFEQFSKSLFSRAASEENRELLDKEANKKLDQQIESYLRLLSGFYLNPAATKTLEYLIRRYKIHVHNVDAAVTCALPYHSTPRVRQARPAVRPGEHLLLLPQRGEGDGRGAAEGSARAAMFEGHGVLFVRRRHRRHRGFAEGTHS